MDKQGVITTVARIGAVSAGTRIEDNGTATNAILNLPCEVAVDHEGTFTSPIGPLGIPKPASEK